jgi:hypothetical protein
VESGSFRPTANEAFRHLLVTGNGLLYLPKDGGARLYRMDNYCVRRDGQGNVMEILIREEISIDALPESRREEIIEKRDSRNEDSRNLELYTWVSRDGDSMHAYQEVEGVVLDDSLTKVPADRAPWIVLRYTEVDGEHYGRSFIDEYIGDLQSLEVLSQSITEGTAVMVKLLLGVKPNGTVRKKDLEEAPNGGIIDGDLEQDVTTLQLDKHVDLQVAAQQAERIEERLKMAFLMHTAIQRQGERVTAEEIRYMANELEDALGGVYSILAHEFQLPLVTRLMHLLSQANKLPQLPQQAVQPTVITGVQALGRGHEWRKLRTLISGAVQDFGPEAVAARINLADYFARGGVDMGIDLEGLVKSEQQVQAEQQAAMRQQQAAEAINRLGPKAMEVAAESNQPQE